MLAGGNTNRKGFKLYAATVSALDIDGVLKYMTDRLGTLDRKKQEKLAQELEQFVDKLNVGLWKTRHDSNKRSL